MKISHFPDFLPDETIYSVASRYMDRMQFPSHLTVAQHFFNRSEVRVTTGLPSFLECLIQALPSYHSYTLDTIIDQHTLFPLYSPFLSSEDFFITREHIKNGTGTQSKTTRSTQLPRHQWLRYCPICIDHDRITYGECYWHRIHQVPRISVCPKHEVLLENSDVSALFVNKLPRFCSAESAINKPSPLASDSRNISTTMLQLAHNAMWLLEHPISGKQQYTQKQYIVLLEKRGFATATGKIRSKRLATAILDYYTIDFLEDLECELSPKRKNRLNSWTLTQDPLHHLLLIQFLCETPQAFFTKHLPSRTPFGNGPWPCLNPLCEHYKERIITSYTVRQGNENQLVARFTCLCGFTYSRTGPDADDDAVFRVGQVVKYGDVWDQHLITHWSDQNISNSQLAHLMHRSIACVCRQAARLELPFDHTTSFRGKRPKIYQDNIIERRDEYRSLLEEGLKVHPKARNKELVKRINKAIAWLKLHDPNWFKDRYSTVIHLPPNEHVLSQNIQKQIDKYMKIDIDLAEAVKKTANEILTDLNFPIRVTQQLLVTRLGDSALLHLSQRSRVAMKGLPLTSIELSRCTETFTTFTWRKLRWAVHNCLNEGVIPLYTSFLKHAHIGFHSAAQPNVKQLVQIAYSNLRTGTLLSEQIPKVGE